MKSEGTAGHDVNATLSSALIALTLVVKKYFEHVAQFNTLRLPALQTSLVANSFFAHKC